LANSIALTSTLVESRDGRLREGEKEKPARREPAGRVPAHGALLRGPPLYEKNYGSEHPMILQAPRRSWK